MKRKAPIQTTLGDLVAVLTEEVTPFVSSEHERNVVVAHLLSDLLSNRAVVANNPRILAV